MTLKYVRDLDTIERMLYAEGTCTQVFIRMKGTFKEEHITTAYKKLLDAYPILRSCIVGNGKHAEFYLNDEPSELPEPYFSERENIEEFLTIYPILQTSEVIRLDVIANNVDSLISFNFKHAIADGMATLGYLYAFAYLFINPELSLPQAPFPSSLDDILHQITSKDIAPYGKVTSVEDFHSSFRNTSVGVPVNWDYFYPAVSSASKIVNFSIEETQHITHHAKSTGVGINAFIYSVILQTEHQLFGSDEQEDWAGVQIVNYRTRLTPNLELTDATNLFIWIPEYYRIKNVSQEDLCKDIKARLNEAIETGSAINSSLNFAAALNLPVKLDSIRKKSARAVSIISNIGAFPRIDAELKVDDATFVDVSSRFFSLGPRITYLIFTTLKGNMQISLSYPEGGFIADEDIDSICSELYARLTASLS